LTFASLVLYHRRRVAMELMQLEMFVAAAEEPSLQKAAERVFRTQPAVTIALHKLEEEVGAPLFDRSGRAGPSLTDAGKLLYEYALRILGSRDEALAALSEVYSLRRGRVRVGANESTCLYVLPSLVAAFRVRYPDIRIEILRQPPAKLPRELRERDLDLAILSFDPEARDLEARPILRDGLVLIAGPDHRLAGRERVHLSELGSEALIAPRRSSGSRRALADAFHSMQVPFNFAVENCSFEAIKKLVSAGAGVGFVPRMCVRGEVERGELVAVSVDGFRHERTLWAVRRRSDSHSHAAQAFFGVIDELGDRLADERTVAC
jgi:DNA-binding transcriptional LysR family regulator